MKLVLVTGMPGAGKSVIAQAFQEVGCPIIVMGDVIREQARLHGFEPNPRNTKKVMLELREKHGLGAVALFCVDELKKLDSELVVIEGCRSIAEIDVFDEYADSLTIVCVHTSPKVRFTRLRERNREDAPTSWEVFRERDIREISVGLGGVIALSDIMLINEGTLTDFQEECIKLVRRLT